VNINDVWIDVSNRIGFFTNESSGMIPNEPGIYAWFIPLWPPKNEENAKDYIEKITNFFSYDFYIGGNNKKATASTKFNWEEIFVSLEKNIITETGSTVEELWGEMKKNLDSSKAFSQALMEATILLPPIYVGKTDDLKGRYLSHVKGTMDKNDFHSRFSDFVDTANYKLAVSDLLFVCIKTSREVNNVFINKRNKGLNFLLEQVIMRIARPPFSLK